MDVLISFRMACFADGLSALATLEKALYDLDALYATIEESYKKSLVNDTYERFEEKA